LPTACQPYGGTCGFHQSLWSPGDASDRFWILKENRERIIKKVRTRSEVNRIGISVLVSDSDSAWVSLGARRQFNTTQHLRSKKKTAQLDKEQTKLEKILLVT
jgi:hypothetical protein